MLHNLKKIAKIIDKGLDRLFAPIVRGLQILAEFLLRILGHFAYQRRGWGVLAIAVVLFACALLIWLGFGIFSGIDTPIQTVQAAEYTAYAGHTADGYIVREETVLRSPREINTLLLAEGQKTAVGQAVAVGYTSLDAQQQRLSVSELESELEQLDYAGSAASVYDQALMDAEIMELLFTAAKELNQEDFAALEESAPHLKGLVLRRYSTEEELAAIRQAAENTKARIRTLQQDLTGSVDYIYSPASGYFSGTLDGFETVLTPRSITTLSVSQLEAIEPAAEHRQDVGKLIAGDIWYYLCTVPEAALKGVWVGDTVTVRFGGENHRATEMELIHLSQAENGKCVAVLSTDRYMPDMTALRALRAEVIFNSYSGLRIPKQAVRVEEDGTVGVFILEGPNVIWKSVELLYDNGESYIVRLDKSSTDNLWPGDEVILSAADLYEGKVVF